MNFKNAAWITRAKPGTGIDIILSIVRNDISLMEIQMIYRIKEIIKLLMMLLIEFPETIYTPSLNFSARLIEFLFNWGGIYDSANVPSGINSIN